MIVFSPCSYEEFHPFLFTQNAKSHYVEFDSFDKVTFKNKCCIHTHNCM